MAIHAKTRSKIQYCIVQYCTVLYSTVQYCTVLYYTVLYSTVQYCTVLHSTAQYCTVLYSTVRIRFGSALKSKPPAIILKIRMIAPFRPPITLIFSYSLHVESTRLRTAPPFRLRACTHPSRCVPSSDVPPDQGCCGLRFGVAVCASSLREATPSFRRQTNGMLPSRSDGFRHWGVRGVEQGNDTRTRRSSWLGSDPTGFGFSHITTTHLPTSTPHHPNPPPPHSMKKFLALRSLRAEVFIECICDVAKKRLSDCTCLCCFLVWGCQKLPWNFGGWPQCNARDAYMTSRPAVNRQPGCCWGRKTCQDDLQFSEMSLSWISMLVPGTELLIKKYSSFFTQHLIEGPLNFRRRVCRSFWLDLAFQDPPGKTDQY